MNPGILIALAGLVVIIGTNYATGLDRANAELNVQPKILLHTADLEGVTFQIQLSVKNPTNASFRAQVPYFKVSYRGMEIASTNPRNETYPIKPNSTFLVDKIFLTVKYTKAVWVGINLKNDIDSGKKVELQVETLSTIYTAGVQTPFKQTDTLVLQK